LSTSVHIRKLPDLDDPWRRLPWLIIAAVITWMVLLLGFSSVLEQSAPPITELPPLEARIIEVPVAGLQGNGAPALNPAPPRVAAPHVAKPKPVLRTHPKKIAEPPPIPVSPEGTLKSKEGAEAPSGNATSSGPATGAGASEGGPSGGGGGIGTDSVGARALYAPVPSIPDDLRDEVIQTEAMAHFTVSYDGTVNVTLTQPTNNLRLNQILLEGLKEWRFAPAVKDGVAIDSAFDVRIPITVQ